jgi:hypothetical protein
MCGRRQQHLWAIAALALLLIGCAPAAPPSPPKTALMQRLEADGAGDLSGASVTTQTVALWLRGKPQAYTQDLRRTCTDLRAQPLTVAWQDSVDSKICGAVDTVSFFAMPPARTDSERFLGGNR